MSLDPSMQTQMNSQAAREPVPDNMPAASDCRGSWQKIHDPDCSILIEARSSPLNEGEIAKLLTGAPYSMRAQGDYAAVMQTLRGLPNALQVDIAQLAERFMALMQADNVRVRFEAVTSNACRKMHADFTDLRLITSYAGPGTQFAPHGKGDCCSEDVPTGAIALFKGKLFGSGHTPCFHRSPPIEGTGEERLVLVIDTPDRDEFQRL